MAVSMTRPTTSSPPQTASTGWSGSSRRRSPSSTRRSTPSPTRWRCSTAERDNLIEAVDQLGKFNALAADSVHQTKEALVQELKDLGPVLESLADAGHFPDPFAGTLHHVPLRQGHPHQMVPRRLRQHDVVVDLTLSRLDSALFTGTRLEGDLTELEMQWGRTVGQLPSPYTGPRRGHRKLATGQSAACSVPMRPGAVNASSINEFKMQLAFFSVIAVVGRRNHGDRLSRSAETVVRRGHYRVTVNMPASGGLYQNGNVTYRGTEVGRVDDVHLTPTRGRCGDVVAIRTKIPADLVAQVHSQTACGEQFVELVPRSGAGPALKNGDVIPADRISVPSDINALLNATNTGLQAIPHDNLKTAIDEAYTAVGGLGPELSRIVEWHDHSGGRCAREPGRVDHRDRPVQADSGHPDRNLGLHTDVGGQCRPDHQSAADTG